MDIGEWLKSLGLGKYEAAFLDNGIGEAVLTHLTVEDLKEIGVATVGDKAHAACRDRCIEVSNVVQRDRAAVFSCTTRHGP
jgi:hypothetical protein